MIHRSLSFQFSRFFALLAVCSTLSFAVVRAQETTTECETGFRLFEHELLINGAVCIPEDPQQIAYLIYPSYLYSFGIKPIGSWGLERDATNFPMIADWITDGVTDIGMPPNLETLTSLAPDLMVFPESRVAEVVEELPLIAPLVLFDDSTNWREQHLFLGAVFGQLEEAEAQLALVDQRITELNAAITASRGNVNDITVALVRIFDPGSYYLGSNRYVAVEILTQIGFQIPEAVRELDDWGVSFSDEEIPLANADVLFLIGSTGGGNNQSAEGDAMVAELMANPLWNTLDAFQANQVFAEGDNFQQSNLFSAHLIIDEIARAFGVETVTPNPLLVENVEATPEATQEASSSS